MIISEFYDYVRELVDANPRDFSDAEIARLANPEANYLYEIAIQGQHLQQTKNAIPTVLTYTMTAPFQQTDHNLWIERVEVSVDGGESFYRIDRTNNADFELWVNSCGGGSLTDQLAEDDARPTSFVQTSQGINIFPMAPSVITKIYIKDTPEIDWNDDNYEILLPNVPIQLLALGTAILYRDIQDVGRLNELKSQYNEKFRIFDKRIDKGGRVIQMRMRTHTVK